MTISHTSKEWTDYTERFHKALAATNKKLFTWFTAKLEDGLTGQQCFILKQIADEERMTSSLLADRMEVKPSAITVSIDRLVHNGFVERLNDPRDRRVTILKLTEKGAAALEKASRQFRDALTRLLVVLDEAEIKPFIQSFERIAAEASKLDS